MGKMDEMQHSIKKRAANQFGEMKNHLSKVPCPTKDYEPRQSLLTKRWLVRPNYEAQSEEEQKENRNSVPNEVVYSYITALGALLEGGKNFTTENPWEVFSVTTDQDGNDYEIQMEI